MFNNSNSNSNNNSSRNNLFFLNLLNNSNNLTKQPQTTQLFNDKNRLNIQMLKPIVTPHRDLEARHEEDGGFEQKELRNIINMGEESSIMKRNSFNRLVMISSDTSIVSERTIQLKQQQQQQQATLPTTNGLNEIKSGAFEVASNSIRENMELVVESRSQNKQTFKLLTNSKTNHSFERKQRVAKYDYENKLLKEASRRRVANRSNELLTLKFNYNRARQNNSQNEQINQLTNKRAVMGGKGANNSLKSEEQEQEQDEKEVEQRRWQMLALQVERTFKRKLIGNLIFAIYCSLIVLVAQHLSLRGDFFVLTQEITTEIDGSNSGNNNSLLVDSNGSIIPTTESSLNGSNLNGTSSHTGQTKLKPVNFTLVDEIFQSFLEEEEVIKRWKFMDTQLQDGMKAILKMLFPQIVAISQDAKVSGDCSGGILKWILSLRNLRSWAIKMLDATGKPTSGIFEGSLTMYGNYKQCLNIRAPDEDEIEITEQFEEYFRGQYCIIHLKPWMPIKQSFYNLNSSIDSLLRRNYKYYEKTLYDELAEIAIAFNFIDIRLDLCVPSTCTMADIQRVADLLSKKVEMRSKVMRCDIASRETNLFNKFDRITLNWIILPIILVLITLLSTIILFIRKVFNKSFINKNKDIINNTEEQSYHINHHGKKLSILNIIKCLSIQENLLDRLRVPNCCLFKNKNSSGSMDLQTELSLATISFNNNNNNNDKQNKNIGSFDFIANKTISTQEINIESNERFNNNNETLINSNLLKPLPLYGLKSLFIFWFIIVQLTVELKYQYLRESLPLRDMIISYWPFQIIINSTLLFESLILITAFTFSFTCLESTLKDLIKYIFDKYLRLLLSIITLISITILTPILEFESPIWKNFVQQQATTCKSTGYLNLIFLQNFITYDKICLPHTWLFSVELQLIILTIPIMLLYKNYFFSIEESLSDMYNNNTFAVVASRRSTNLLIILKIFYSKIGFTTVLLVSIGLIAKFTTVFTNQLPPSWFYTFPDLAQKNYYFSEYFIKTWTHLSVFMIGLFAGHLCRVILQINSINGGKSSTIAQNTTLIYNNNNSPKKQKQFSSNHDLTQQEQQQASSPNSSTHLRSYGGSTSTMMAMESPQNQNQNHNNNNSIDHSQQQQQTIDNDWRSSNQTSTSSPATSLKQSSQMQQQKHPSNGRIVASMEENNFSINSKSLGDLSYPVAAIVCMSAVIFSTFSWSTTQLPSPLVSGLYDVFSRLFWSIALVYLMIQLCLDTNRQTLFAKILTHPICTLLGRLSFLAYLISPYINTFILAVQEQALFPSLFIIFHIIVGNIVIIYLVAFILAILIEQPIRRLISRFILIF